VVADRGSKRVPQRDVTRYGELGMNRIIVSITLASIIKDNTGRGGRLDKGCIMSLSV
jgi:hypothetical protein